MGHFCCLRFEWPVLFSRLSVFVPTKLKSPIWLIFCFIPPLIMDVFLTPKSSRKRKLDDSSTPKTPQSSSGKKKTWSKAFSSYMALFYACRRYEYDNMQWRKLWIHSEREIQYKLSDTFGKPSSGTFLKLFF